MFSFTTARTPVLANWYHERGLDITTSCSVAFNMLACVLRRTKLARTSPPLRRRAENTVKLLSKAIS